MIFIKMSRLFYILGIGVLIFIPFVVPALMPFGAHASGIEVIREAQIIPLFLIGEILIYFFFGLFSGGAASVYRLILYSFVAAFGRFLICLFSGSIFASVRLLHPTYSIILFWMGNPVVVMIQILFVMLFAPYAISKVAPGFLSDEAHRRLIGETGAGKPQKPISFQPEGAPIGGFIQVYTFPEMGRLIANMSGIEGYVIYSWEGLVMWKDMRVRMDADRLAVLSQQQLMQFQEAQSGQGLGEMDKLIVLTSEHCFIHLPFTSKFYAVLLFRRDVRLGDVLGRLKYIERTARELFSMKYSPLL